MEMEPDIKNEIVSPTTIFWNKKNVLGITNRKLGASFYIDDRAIRHVDWNSSLDAIQKYENY